MEAQLNLSLGRRLDPERSETTVTAEPVFGLPVKNLGSLHFSTTIQRPFDPYQNFRIPKTRLTWEIPFEYFQVFATGNALELDRWKIDGAMFRQSVGAAWRVEATPGLRFPMRLGPFLQWNDYRLRTDGRGLAQYGFFERFGLEYDWNRLQFEIYFNIEQHFTGVWKNDYATFERLSYRFTDGVRGGVAHELLSSVVDETTGTATSFSLFDGRESQVSLVMQWVW